MNKPLVILIAGAVILSAGISVAFFLPEEKALVVKSSDVYTWDCEYPERKPEAITLTCGDGGQYIDEITWNTWGGTGAQGTGIYHVNDCDPSCAEGNFHSTSVTIALSDLETYQGESYLRSMIFETTSGENLPNSGKSFYQWDLMDFIEGMEKN